MKHFLSALAILSLTATHAQAPAETEYLPGDILVMLRPEAAAVDIVRDLAVLDGVATGLKVVEEASAPMRIWLLHFDPGTVAQERMLDAVRRHAAVMIAQNNHTIQQRLTPNDPQYNQQWHHVDASDNDIDTDLAWDITTGGTTAMGDAIVVCQVEGFDRAHADLNANAWVNPYEIDGNAIDDDGNGYVDDVFGWNPSAGNDNTLFTGSHGTSCAGMIGARGNNGTGVVGANWNVKMMPVRVGSLTESNVIASYTYPLVQRRRYNDSNGTTGAFVVSTNSSWGIDNANPTSYPLWCAFYDTLGSEGILSCAATTNNNVNVDVVGDMPTGCGSPYMISVTATNSSDMRTFSGYGVTRIDVGAPGESVRTTTSSSGYTTTSGTSFASPLTAGVIALLYSAPCTGLIQLAKNNPAAGAMAVRAALFNGVDQVGNLPGNTVTGGRINANNSLLYIATNCATYSPGVQVAVKAWLEGPLVPAPPSLMVDSLRTLAGFPLAEPYTAMGFANYAGGGAETTTAPILAITGNNAIVDWVRVELRTASDPAAIVATRHALIQRDGDVVSATDGTSNITFNVGAGNYYVAIRHRNHLGAMTATAIALSSTATTIDFRLVGTATYGTDARKNVSGVMALWAGNTLLDAPAPYKLIYTGVDNDRDPILSAIGGVVPTNVVTGYLEADVNMDGRAKYTGSGNDRDLILGNIGGVVPTNSRIEQLP